MKNCRGHKWDSDNEDAICAACEAGRWEVEDPDEALCPVLTMDGHVFSTTTGLCWKCHVHRRYIGDDDPGCAVDLRALIDQRGCDGKGCYDDPSRSASPPSLEGGVESRGVLAPGEGSALGMVPGPILSPRLPEVCIGDGTLFHWQFRSEFGPYLRAARTKVGLSLRALAEAVGVSFTYLQKVETGGRYKAPTPELMARIARLCGIPATEVLGEAGLTVRTALLNDRLPEEVSILVHAALTHGTRAKVLGPWIPCRVDLYGKTAHCRRDLSGAMVAVCNEDSDRARIDAGCRADGWVLTECNDAVLRVAL